MTESPLVKPRTRCTWSASEKAEWLALFERSGQCLAEFCRDNGLSPATLSFWRTRALGRSDASEEGALVELPQAALGSSSGSVPDVIVRLHSGVQLQIPPGTDPAWLAELLRSLLPPRDQLVFGITSETRVYLRVGTTDGRLGFEGLRGLVVKVI